MCLLLAQLVTEWVPFDERQSVFQLGANCLDIAESERFSVNVEQSHEWAILERLARVEQLAHVAIAQ